MKVTEPTIRINDITSLHEDNRTNNTHQQYHLTAWRLQKQQYSSTISPYCKMVIEPTIRINNIASLQEGCGTNNTHQQYCLTAWRLRNNNTDQQYRNRPCTWIVNSELWITVLWIPGRYFLNCKFRMSCQDNDYSLGWRADFYWFTRLQVQNNQQVHELLSHEWMAHGYGCNFLFVVESEKGLFRVTAVS